MYFSNPMIEKFYTYSGGNLPLGFSQQLPVNETLEVQTKNNLQLCSEKVITLAGNGFSLVIKSAALCSFKLGFSLLALKNIDYYNLDFSVQNPWLRYIGQITNFITHTKVAVPAYKILNMITPEISISGINFSEIIIKAGVEELLFRGLIQKVALPLISNVLPKRAGNILNHTITRVAITSILFGLSHFKTLDYNSGIVPQLIGGLIYGTLVEMPNGWPLAILSHSLFNIGIFVIAQI